MAGKFASFESYRLNGVQLTEEEFGRGSYAVVLRLEYRGLKCAGKQLYPVLYEQGVGDTIRRFEEECRLLAQMRHPNIVQFIGVYFEEGSHVPILVMEFLSTTLARCINTYGVLPEEVSYSILHDVALGLYHLHSQTPPIVHRDLSANNVLLASNMTAKISDLGVARILNLTPQQMSRMTRAPGTPAYMPPEARRANPRYDSRIDEFSYGVLMIHVFCGRWPLPLCEAARSDPQNPDQLIPVSEADRREEYLRDIGNSHPLMDLILRCISNNPARRARAAESVQRLGDMLHQFPPSFADKIEMLQRIETETNEKQTLSAESQRLVAEAEQNQLEREELIQHHQAEVEQVRTEMRAQDEIHQIEMRAQNETHRAEVEQVRTEVKAELNAQHTAAQTQLRGEIQKLEQLALHRQEETEHSELEHSIEIVGTRLQLQEALQTELSTQTETHQTEMRAQNETHHTEMRALNETHQAEMMAQNETHQVEMRAQNEVRKQERRSLTNQLDSLQKEVSRLRGVNESLQATALERQSSTIRELYEQLTRAREFLSGQKPQPHPLHPQAKIAWKRCRDLPAGMYGAQTVVIRERVYCGGGDAADHEHNYWIFCYSPSEDTWNTLPATDVLYFGLGQVRGKLVTVGGIKRSGGKVTNEVYEFDEVTNWKQSIPPMPTSRRSPTVLSHHSTLTVAGGYTGHTRTSVVEVFREETSQWYTTEPFPFCWCDPSSLVINNRWYLLGGRADDEYYSNRAVCGHIDLLLQKALPRDQASTGRDSTNNSAWEVLPNTPLYGLAAATFGTSLLAVGGSTTNERSLNPPEGQTAIHVYSPCTNAWIQIGDLPAPRVWTAIAMLSPTEILVIGGWNSHGSQNSVYKGLLRIE